MAQDSYYLLAGPETRGDLGARQRECAHDPAEPSSAACLVLSAAGLWTGGLRRYSETCAAGLAGLSVTALAPLFILLLVLTADAWVYLDSKARVDRGAPVVCSNGIFRMATPAAWLFGCLILWLLFFPLYLICRGQRG